MKTPIIDSLFGITLTGNAGSSPELVAISGEDLSISSEALNEMEQLLMSLTLDDKVFNSLMNMGSAIFADGEEYGFRRGFRVAMHLMTECLQGQEVDGSLRGCPGA